MRIVEPILRRKVVQKPVPGKATMITEYILSGKWQDEELYLPSISHTYGYINNNLNLTCVPSKSDWFTSTTRLIKEEHLEKLRCETTMNHNIDP